MEHSSLEFIDRQALNGSALPVVENGEPTVENNIRTLRDVAQALSTAAEVLETNGPDGSQRIDVEGGIDLDIEVSRFETELIRRALVRTHGNQKRASVLLNLKPTTLNTKIKKYNIRVEA